MLQVQCENIWFGWRHFIRGVRTFIFYTVLQLYKTLPLQVPA
ncbi:hypothetical protein PDTA9759_49830 [Phytobacter diazotrophicus]|uniref:Uncharacterized protein n=1 Tax=Phytobacter diazotrophicus TaxID=395631 RepID=A0ABM7W1R4_9ENTR|nr:hypothetical protein PDTA9734_49870 [Phytobacter diazotrophicus]BEG84430.1 hypothetical protein PDTA9730_48860 [Phytobacter diazotrophicus]BEG90327.1 hypothetical protein PDTA9759_49830 [Phytobacter diazotrophicus]BEG96090.1 hypothetical protein PDTA9832_49490 [Phytobacter diazotrophicus]